VERSTPTIGSVTVTYNSGAVIDRHVATLATLRGLTSISVIDNDSTDDTWTQLQWLAGRRDGPRVRLERSPTNIGFGGATNRAARGVETDLLLVVNPDVFIEDPELLAEAVRSFDDPRVAMVGCGLYQADGTLDHACKRGEPTVVAGLAYQLGVDRIVPGLARYRAGHVGEAEVAPVDAINGAFMLIRKAAFDECGGFDERYWMYAEDLDLCRQLRSRGWTVLYRGDLRATHLKGRSSGDGRTDRRERAFYRSSVLYYRKWYGRRSPQTRLVSLLARARLAAARLR
jgi:GT2 family glycosyltransferase